VGYNLISLECLLSLKFSDSKFPTNNRNSTKFSSSIRTSRVGLEVNISPISVLEIESIAILDRLCFGGLWSIDSYRRELENENSYFLGIGCDPHLEIETKGMIGFGCFWAILDEAHITLLGIHPRYQGRGLGQLLLCALLDRAREVEMARATLEVRDSNHSAFHIYEKYGFQTVGRRKKYYQDTGEDGVIMWRGGLQHPHFPQELNGWMMAIRNHL
jgi:[ribosomal protein S18]-alanine N-acetyltransferase